jgi:hypothetical protein
MLFVEVDLLGLMLVPAPHFNTTHPRYHAARENKSCSGLHQQSPSEAKMLSLKRTGLNHPKE